MPVSINNTQVVFNDATVQTTAGYPNTNPSGFTSNTGTVTSVATGNGLQGGTITTTGTLSVACPAANTVGSYVFGGTRREVNNFTVTYGSNYSAGTSFAPFVTGGVMLRDFDQATLEIQLTGSILSGTWKWMSASFSSNANQMVGGILCRVS